MQNAMKVFDRHSDRITRKTPMTRSYRNTQNVRRGFSSQCGPHLKLDRTFMAWLETATDKTMGDAVDEWKSRKRRDR
jgi:hypothetical protein